MSFQVHIIKVLCASYSEIKERIKKTKDEKKAKKAEIASKSKSQSKGSLPKGGAQGKGPKLGGGGGKRWAADIVIVNYHIGFALVFLINFW